ncbi:MAG: sigma-54-dependent Fis family transcriptional regulator, partial [Gemmataceae bacterium]|nr:sigma-54-dependent Fis family transcriptional regulator [Gemmataceae bacterium]
LPSACPSAPVGYGPAPAATASPAAPPPTAPAVVPFPPPQPGQPAKSLADVEMEYILQVYAKNNYNKQATAAELGISLKTLYNKLHRYEEERRLKAG